MVPRTSIEANKRARFLLGGVAYSGLFSLGHALPSLHLEVANYIFTLHTEDPRADGLGGASPLRNSVMFFTASMPGTYSRRALLGPPRLEPSGRPLPIKWTSEGMKSPGLRRGAICAAWLATNARETQERRLIGGGSIRRVRIPRLRTPFPMGGRRELPILRPFTLRSSW